MCRLLMLPCEICSSIIGAVNECLCGICGCIGNAIMCVLRVLCLPCKCVVDCVYRAPVREPLLLQRAYYV